MQDLDIQQVLLALKRALPQHRPLPLHTPRFDGNELAYVKQCLDRRAVSSTGDYVDRFEGMLCDYTGAKHAIAVVNGTAALHVGLKLIGVQSGDEVLVPTLAFIATANAVSYCGAVPHFVDIDEKTLGVDAIKLADYLDLVGEMRVGGCFNKNTGSRIRALIAVHTFGHPVDLDELRETCEKYKIVLIEDAAQSLGSRYKGNRTGNFGRVAALSFNGNKVVTTGGGGALLTNDDDLARMAKHLTTNAKGITQSGQPVYDQVGFNYRLPAINAAIGCAQMERLRQLIEDKRQLAQKYIESFSGFPGATIFQEPLHATSNYWLNALVLDADQGKWRDELISRASNDGIMARPVWPLLHTLGIFQACPRMDLNTANNLEKRIVALPS